VKWVVYIHHTFLHAPIVLSFVWAAVGLYSLSHESDATTAILRWGGWITFGLTSVTALSGIIVAPGWLGGAGSEGLTHHRSLGVVSWVAVGIASWAYDKGVRRESSDWRHFAVGVWCVASLSVIGTGHWGAAERHPEVVPWSDAPYERPERRP
jgi:hypothetical protein